MKILYFGGGLGNQIFEYSFYLELKDRYPKEKIEGIYPSFKFKEHKGGFEIERLFDVKLPKTSWKAKLIICVLFFYKKAFPKTKLCSLNNTIVNWNSIVFNAFKSDLSFYENRREWIKFKPIYLDTKNQKIIDLMLSTESVAIHVRRGDYLSAKYCDILGGIATPHYYKMAIRLIDQKLINPYFFIFSDDIDWCRNNLLLPKESIYIDWNIGRESYLDMYLMTYAKANIIANSTFSYWGAYLNKNNSIVVYPRKWINGDFYPNIFPNKWIGISSE